MIEFQRKDFEKYTDRKTFDKIIEIETIPKLLQSVRDNYGDLKAFGLRDGSVKTFRELVRDVFSVCVKLKDCGVERGDYVSVLSGNNYEFVVASLAVMNYGAVAVLLPAQLPKEAILECLMNYDVKFMLFENNLVESAELFENRISINDCLDKNADDDFELNCEEIKKDMSACVVLTGGTTGKSKGVLLTHFNIMSGVINGCYGIPEPFHQVYYSMMPLTHVFGLIRNMLTSIYTGSLMYFNYEKPAMVKDLQAYQPTVMVIVPALAEMFLNLMKQFGDDVLGGKLKTVIAGGASVPSYITLEYAQRGINLCPGYGMTEMANMVSGNPEPTKYPDSVGMLFPGVQGKIVNEELWLRGDNLTPGYIKEDEENAKSFEDGWFKTGDLAYFDENKFLYITGRIKELIVLPNGENVSPAFIEGKFNEFAIIQDSLVFEKDGKLVVEVILRKSEILKEKIEDENAAVLNILEKVNNGLRDFEKVTEISIRANDFERSPSMKILRPKQ